MFLSCNTCYNEYKVNPSNIIKRINRSEGNMKYISKELNEWAIDKIKNNYKEDIDLLIGNEHWKIPEDGNDVSFNFFVPSTDKGYELCNTFIINGIGYDLFPMSWERIEGLANLDESLTTCLADGVVLYAKDDSAIARFEDLRKKLHAHLADSRFTYVKGIEKINTAMDLYKSMLFESSSSKIRKAGGYIAFFLGQALTTFNGTYFKRGPENQLVVIKELEQYPEEFEALFTQLIYAKTDDDVKTITYQMIELLRNFFEQHKPESPETATAIDYSHLVGWYEEGTYTFRRIDYYCNQGNVFNAYSWGCHFQQELDSIKEEFNMNTMDLLSEFDPTDLQSFKSKAKEVDKYIRQFIEDQGVTIEEYSTLEEFLINNK